jgi:hypothetical protein
LAAVAKGIVIEFEEAIMTFRDNMVDSTGYENRCLFASMTINGFPTMKIYNDDVFNMHLIKDYVYKGKSVSEAKNMLLHDLNDLFALEDRSLKDFGLPQPKCLNTEYEKAMAKYDKNEENVSKFM